MKDSPMDVSIVVPLYHEEENVGLLVSRVVDVMRTTGRSFELICIDDGSRDQTPARLARLALEYPELVPLYFRRNYGQTAAMQAGFDRATGDVVVTMDGDLQNDPADIPALLARMDETGADIVSGWRKDRQDNELTSNFPSRVANFLIARITGVKLHDSGCSLKAYKKEIFEDLRIYGELHRFIPAVAAQYGARIEEVVVTHHARQFGASKYGLDKTVRVVLDVLQLYFFQRYLHRPMHFFGYAGLLCAVPGGLLAMYLTALKILGFDIGHRPLLLLSVMLILMGVQLLAMGILGELLVRIYHEPSGRKQYTLRAAPRVEPLKAAKPVKATAKKK